MAKHAKLRSADVGGVQVVALNKKARRDYEIIDVYEAGLALLGCEVKSIRGGGINLSESYVKAVNGELFLLGCHISPYAHMRADRYDPVRERKLLMNRREIDKLSAQTQQKGLTIIPLRAYFKNGRCKLEIGLGKGKKLWDKRQDVKGREADRAMERALKRR